MIIDPITLIAGIAGVASSVSAIYGAGKIGFDLYKYFTELNSIGKYRLALEKTSKVIQDKTSAVSEKDSNKEFNEFLEFWISHGEIPFIFIKQRIIKRAIISLLIIISVQIAASEIKPLTEQDTLVELIQAIIQILTGVFTVKNPLVKGIEQQFLILLNRLDKAFYREHVIKTISVFNKGLGTILNKPEFLGTIENEEREQKNKKIRDSLNQLEKDDK